MTGVIYYFLPFVFSTAAAFFLTPFVLRAAVKFQVLDIPNQRKSHEKAIPSMGGLAIFTAFFCSLGAFDVFYSIFWSARPAFAELRSYHLFFVVLPLIITGVLDDKFRLNYKIKLSAQLVSVFLMIYFGYGIYGITNPINGQTVSLGFFSIPVTVFWFLFIINAVNLIDGIDGLAAGVSLIAVITIFVISLYLGNIQMAMIAAILSGSIVGFLRYNFSPASIFMGDTGSLFLGFMLAVLSMLGSQKSSTVVAITIPIAILGLPILDTVLAVIRRWSAEWMKARSFSERIFSWKKIFFADRGHIHHRLLDLGITKRRAVILLYLISIGFAMIGLILTAARYRYVALILLYMGIVFFVAFRKFPAVKNQMTSFESNSEEPHK